LLDFGSEEKSYSPPDRVVRSVAGYYGLLQPWKVESPVAMIPSLVFDSFLEPLAAGIRSSQLSPRRLVYFAGDLVIDLRLEHRARRLRLVGQAERRGPDPSVGEMRVAIQRETKTVARTRCNRYGEFQVELMSKESDEFSVVLSRGKSVVIIPLHGNRSREGRSLKI